MDRDLQEVGVHCPDQHASFVAGADHAHAQRRAQGLLVAEVEASQPAAGHSDRCHARLEEIAPCEAGAALLGGHFFRSQICHSSVLPTQTANYCHSI